MTGSDVTGSAETFSARLTGRTDLLARMNAADHAQLIGETASVLNRAEMAVRHEVRAVRNVRNAAPGRGLMHSVGGIQHRLDRLDWKTPNALCGELLDLAPREVGPSLSGPLCPACTLIGHGVGASKAAARTLGWAADDAFAAFDVIRKASRGVRGEVTPNPLIQAARGLAESTARTGHEMTVTLSAEAHLEAIQGYARTLLAACRALRIQAEHVDVLFREPGTAVGSWPRRRNRGGPCVAHLYRARRFASDACRSLEVIAEGGRS